MIEFTIDNTQALPIALAPVDSNGNVAKLAGPAVFAVVSGNSKVVNISADGLSAILFSEDGVGDTVITVTGDPGQGNAPLVETITLHVTAPVAVALRVTAGSPVPKSTVVITP